MAAVDKTATSSTFYMADFCCVFDRLRTMKLRQAVLVLAMAAVLGTTGCQTFSMTDEQFERQQHGQPTDPEVGVVVGAAGSVGYLGAMIGAAVTGKH